MQHPCAAPLSGMLQRGPAACPGAPDRGGAAQLVMTPVTPPAPPGAPAANGHASGADAVIAAVQGGVAQIGALAGAAAGAVGLLYVIGGAVMWLRFLPAGLPADQAVALVPKTDLLVLGLRVMVLPVLAAGALLLGL